VGQRYEEVIARLRALVDDKRVWAVACACLAIATALAWWRMGASHAPPPAPARASAPSFDAPATTVAARPRLVLDVVGAVRRPGIVRVDAGARVADAITAAGGATTDADLVRLNLAAPVADGARIAVPAIGGPAPPLDAGAISGGPPDAAGGPAAGPVNVNTATAEQLDALPGVGPATAAAIVKEREAHGPFRSVDDLGRVRGIGPAKLAQLHDLVTV
jgi:competence protein ComEA